MDGSSILKIILVLVLLYIVFSYIVQDANKLTDISNGKDMIKISPETLATSDSSNATNFTYSIWFYIDDWNYRYGEPKVIFGRMGAVSVSDQGTIGGIGGIDPCPAVVLGAVENNIIVSLGCYAGKQSPPDTTTSGSCDSTQYGCCPDGTTGKIDDAGSNCVSPGGSIVHNCSVSNVPIQKWVNLLVSVYGRTMDLYIDGKLVRTCLLPGVAKINPDSPVVVTPKGGFAGWTSKLQYWPNSTDPQEAWNIYMKGYGASWLQNIFGEYKIEISITKNGEETSSVEL